MRKVSYANVTATLALVVALGGTSYAAFELPARSVGTRELKPAAVTAGKLRAHTITAAQIKPKSLTPALFANGALPAGTPGPKGDTGPAGPAGPIAGTPAGGALAGTYPNPRLAATEPPHVVGASGEPAYSPFMQAYGSPGFADLAFYRDALGAVHLSGLACRRSLGAPGCIDGVGFAGSQLVFTLPEGYRPASGHVFTGLSFGMAAYYHSRIDVAADGSVSVTYPPQSGIAWMSFEGIDFRAA